MTRTWARRALLAGFGGGALAGVVDAIATLSASAGILDVLQLNSPHRHRQRADRRGWRRACADFLGGDSRFGASASKNAGPSRTGDSAHSRFAPARPRCLRRVLRSKGVAHSWARFAVGGSDSSGCGGNPSRALAVGPDSHACRGRLRGKSRRRWREICAHCRDRARCRRAGDRRANRVVLPRLDPWFHLSLSAIELVLWVLALRLLLGLRRWARDWMVGLVLVGGLAVGLTLGLPALANSQSLRFFVYEKSQLASIIMRYLPMRKTAVALPGASPTAAALPPLPSRDRTGPTPISCSSPSMPCAPIRSGLLRVRASDHAQHRRPCRPRREIRARVRPGAAHVVLARLADDWKVLPDVGSPWRPRICTKPWPSFCGAMAGRRRAFFPPAVFYIDAHKMKAFEANNFDFEYVKYEFLPPKAVSAKSKTSCAWKIRASCFCGCTDLLAAQQLGASRPRRGQKKTCLPRNPRAIE